MGIAGSGILAWVRCDVACHQCAARLCAFIADRRISNFCIFRQRSLFAIHGSRPEAVVWIASHFDRVSRLFCSMRACPVHSVAGESKASGNLQNPVAGVHGTGNPQQRICIHFPAVALALSWFFPGSAGFQPAVAAGTAALPGIFEFSFLSSPSRRSCLPAAGFYSAESVGTRISRQARPMAATIRFVPAVKVLFFRLWAVLFFPVNWKIQPGLILSVFLAACILRSHLDFHCPDQPKTADFSARICVDHGVAAAASAADRFGFAGRKASLPPVRWILPSACNGNRKNVVPNAIYPPVNLDWFSTGSARAQSGKVGIRFQEGKGRLHCGRAMQRSRSRQGCGITGKS